MYGNWRGTLPAFDASSIIHAWDHYPVNQFPKLWVWLGEQTQAEQFVVPEAVDGEVKDRAPDCHKWLHQHNPKIIPPTPAILADALKLKAMLGIVNDKYNRAGVGENDLIIIATCIQGHLELVSNEGVQTDLPQNLAKCKIPAVCAMTPEKVACIDFRQVIMRSGKVF